MIIEANGKYYTTTLHTDERMLLRSISAEQIKQTIENGEQDVTEDGDEIYTFEITRHRIAVIIVDDERIITVYPVE